MFPLLIFENLIYNSIHVSKMLYHKYVGNENSFPKVPLLEKGWVCNCFQSCARDAVLSSSWRLTSHSQNQISQQTHCLHCPSMEITQEMLANWLWLRNHNWPFLHGVWWQNIDKWLYWQLWDLRREAPIHEEVHVGLQTFFWVVTGLTWMIFCVWKAVTRMDMCFLTEQLKPLLRTES